MVIAHCGLRLAMKETVTLASPTTAEIPFAALHWSFNPFR